MRSGVTWRARGRITARKVSRINTTYNIHLPGHTPPVHTGNTQELHPRSHGRLLNTMASPQGYPMCQRKEEADHQSSRDGTARRHNTALCIRKNKLRTPLSPPHVTPSVIKERTGSISYVFLPTVSPSHELMALASVSHSARKITFTAYSFPT